MQAYNYSLLFRYKVTKDEFANFSGKVYFRGSPYVLLSTVYSDHEFLPWLFSYTPRFTFENREMRHKYIRWLINKVGRDDLTFQDLLENNGRALFDMYDESVRKVLASIAFEPPTPRIIAQTIEILRNEIGPKLGIDAHSVDAWKTVPIDRFLQVGGFSLLECFHYSYDLMLSFVFHQSWSSTKIASYKLPLREDLWKRSENVRAFMEHFAEHHGIPGKDFDSWYDLKIDAILELEESGLLQAKNRDIVSILSVAFPEHNWNPNWFFYLPQLLPRREDIHRARNLLLKSWAKLGFREGNYSAWYGVRTPALVRIHWEMMHQFDHSRFKLFSATFPEHKWYPWRFFNAKKSRLVLNPISRKHLAKYLEELLGITRPRDWYGISNALSSPPDFPLSKLFPMQKDFIAFLRGVYPNMDWHPEKMAWSSMGISIIDSTLHALFPDNVVPLKQFLEGKEEISTKVFLHYRIFIIPSAKLAVEYQGPIDFAEQIIKDAQDLICVPSRFLSELSAKHGLTPIVVPFWWNRHPSSLLALIKTQRKDLFEDGALLANRNGELELAEPIPTQHPLKELRLNKTYARSWQSDPRFEGHFLASD